MKILALDTSGNTATVAFLCGETILAELSLNHKKTHSATLMPLISSLLDTVEQRISDVDYIAVSEGPGSFTGIRIGAATAKAITHASGKNIVPVPTLLAIAYNVYDTDKLIVPVMDARRGLVYTAAYMREKNRLNEIFGCSQEPLPDVIARTQKHGTGLFLGDGVLNESYRAMILQSGHEITSPNNCLQRASSVGLAAIEIISRGHVKGYSEFTPFYLRKPQAEREMLLRRQN